MVDGRDLLDGPIEIGLGTAITNVTLTLTDRHNELGGTLRDAAGAPGLQVRRCRVSRRPIVVDHRRAPAAMGTTLDRRILLVR